MHFPLPSPVIQLLHRLRQAGHEAFLVGGCVRDWLRGMPPKDYDIATRARPEQVKLCFSKVIPTGIAHGTVTVLLGGQAFEVTTYRTEGAYVDGRRPTQVHFHASIEEDLARRDFTINAIAYNPLEDTWVDPWEGRADLHKALVRCVGNPLHRFAEDGLRLIRAVRFATTLNFALEPATQSAIGQRLDVFEKVAIERIREEFLKLLASPHAQRGLELLLGTGLLHTFMPEATCADFAAVARPPTLLPRLALLLVRAPHPQAALLRLKLPNKTSQAALHLLAAQPPPRPDEDDVQLRRWLSKATQAHWEDALALAEAQAPEYAPLRARLHAVLAHNPALSVDKLALRGEEIGLILGAAPGPRIGQAGRFLLQKVLENPSLNSKYALSQLLRTWNQ